MSFIPTRNPNADSIDLSGLGDIIGAGLKRRRQSSVIDNVLNESKRIDESGREVFDPDRFFAGLTSSGQFTPKEANDVTKPFLDRQESEYKRLVEAEKQRRQDAKDARQGEKDALKSQIDMARLNLSEQDLAFRKEQQKAKVASPEDQKLSSQLINNVENGKISTGQAISKATGIKNENLRNNVFNTIMKLDEAETKKERNQITDDFNKERIEDQKRRTQITEQGLKNQQRRTDLTERGLINQERRTDIQQSDLERKIAQDQITERQKDEDLAIKREAAEAKKVSETDIKNAENLLSNVANGKITPSQLQEAAVNIQNENLRNQLFTTARTMESNQVKYDEASQADRNSRKLDEFKKKVDDSAKNALVADNTLFTLSTVAPQFEEVTRKDQYLEVLEENGLIGPTVKKMLQSDVGAQVTAASKDLIANKASLIGGSNPNQMQTKILQDAAIHVGRDPKSNQIVALYLQKQAEYDKARYQIAQEAYSQALDGAKITPTQVDKMMDAKKQQLAYEFVLLASKIRDPENMTIQDKKEVARIQRAYNLLNGVE